MASTILELVAVVSSILGFFLAIKGAVKTQSVLLQGNQHDKVIDALAWFDRRVYRPDKQTAGAGRP